MKIVNWFYDNNTDSINLIGITLVCNLISLININIISLYCYYLFWGNVNTKVKSITNNQKVGDYTSSFIHSLGLMITIFVNIFLDSNYVRYHILYYTMSYFLYDINIIVEHKYSKLFLYHHIMSIINLLIGIFNTRFLDYTLTCLLIGELSNPLQNLWNIAKIKNNKHQDIIFKYFTYSFLGLRAIVFPIYWFKSGLIYEDGYSGLLYNINMSLGLITSYVWGYKMIKIYYSKFIKKD
jgi:hypothetical protein